jgi:hypothetical protein
MDQTHFSEHCEYTDAIYKRLLGLWGEKKTLFWHDLIFFSSIIVKLGDLAQWQRLGGLHVSEGGISR